ncbi:PaaI family thioesterase [Hyphomonas johnsonii]|uniref:Phenylacetic acid degradation-like protein n=1 Tax=Hyphomonas johnsonii MHS-2 TaxID=1280950 RepID=A0A059FTJ7_9PROT|nr:hotdog fold thioesterase [Hyphomonas johnsonii]KCZ93984.1 phenylacetic acid degradation-like protein [Hyphomonas johnsonii MHS-2]
MSIWRQTNIDLDQISAAQQDTMGGLLGITLVGIGDDTLTARMPVDHRTIQPHGRLHGGASVALAETVGSIAANLVLDPGESVGVGLEINANHIRPVKDGFVFATAKAEALGRTTQIWTIRITDESDRLVCLSRFTVAVIPARRA